MSENELGKLTLSMRMVRCHYLMEDEKQRKGAK